MKIRTKCSVELIDHMGDDDGIVDAALLINRKLKLHGKNTKRFINMLIGEKHGTPFEHNCLTFIIKAPVFVIWQWKRHRIGWSYQIESGRYRKLEPVFFVPPISRPVIEGDKFSPMKAQHKYDYTSAVKLRDTLIESYKVSWENYQKLLNNSLARELSRAALPFGLMLNMRATCNVRSLMHFLALRTRKPFNVKVNHPSFPQLEIHDVAKQLEKEFKNKFPLTHEAFNENGREAP